MRELQAYAKFFIHALVLMSLTFNLHASSLEEAKKLYDLENYSEAIPIIENYLDSPEAQYMLGKAYLYGLGVPKDEKKAFEFAKKSADAKLPTGINLLGLFYLDGIIVEKDGLMASSLFLQAANLGNAYGMYNLGRMYFDGTFFPKDIDKGILWTEKAIANNHPTAIIDLANLYTDGKAIPKDNLKATYWFKKAIEKGNSNAVALLANFYTHNDIQDWNKAKYYFELYLKEYVTKKDEIDSKMGPFYYMYGLTLERLGEFKKAHAAYIKSIDYNYASALIDLYLLADKHKELGITDNEKLELLKKAHLFGDNYASFLLYSYYYELENFQKALEVAEYAYSHGNKRMGCNLATIYSLANHNFTNYKKAFEISSKIFNEDSLNKDVVGCGFTLAQLYVNGQGTSKNIQKAIEVVKQTHELSEKNGEKNHVIVAYIGSLYYEKLNNIEEAINWYKIAYSMSNQEEYLTIINTLKTKPKISNEKEILSTSKQNIFPILNSQTNLSNIANTLETNNYIIVSDSKKSIIVYDKKTFKSKYKLRGFVGNGIDGIAKNLAFDEKNELLFTTNVFYTSNLHLNNQINIYDIKKEKVVNTLLAPMEVSNMFISSDGNFLLNLYGLGHFGIINRHLAKLICIPQQNHGQS